MYKMLCALLTQQNQALIIFNSSYTDIYLSLSKSELNERILRGFSFSFFHFAVVQLSQVPTSTQVGSVGCMVYALP